MNKLLRRNTTHVSVRSHSKVKLKFSPSTEYWTEGDDVKRLPLTFEFSRQYGNTSAISRSKQILQSLSDSLRVRSSANEFTLLLCILSVLIKYTQQLYLKQDSILHHSVTSTHHSGFRQDIIDIVNLFFMCSRWVKTFTTLIKIEQICKRFVISTMRYVHEIICPTFQSILMDYNMLCLQCWILPYLQFDGHTSLLHKAFIFSGQKLPMKNHNIVATLNRTSISITNLCKLMAYFWQKPRRN